MRANRGSVMTIYGLFAVSFGVRRGGGWNQEFGAWIRSSSRHSKRCRPRRKVTLLSLMEEMADGALFRAFLSLDSRERLSLPP